MSPGPRCPTSLHGSVEVSSSASSCFPLSHPSHAGLLASPTGPTLPRSQAHQSCKEALFQLNIRPSFCWAAQHCTWHRGSGIGLLVTRAPGSALPVAHSCCPLQPVSLARPVRAGGPDCPGPRPRGPALSKQRPRRIPETGPCKE